MHAELAALGIHVGRKRVARLMRALGVHGVSRRRRPRTTLRDPANPSAPDLVARDFTAPGPDQLWVADITYIPTWAGFLYLAVVLDAWSRCVIGWAMASHLRTELVLAALPIEQLALEGREEALAQRVVVGVAYRAHRGPDARLATPAPEGERRVLAPLVRVMDEAGGPPLRHGHVPLRHAGGRPSGSLRLHRGMVRPAPPAFRAGLPVPA